MPLALTLPELDNPSWARLSIPLVLNATAPGVIWWGLVRMTHPFSITVEPSEQNGWTGIIRLLVANRPTAPMGKNYPQLGDPITGPFAFMYDVPVMWIGASLEDTDPPSWSGSVSVHVRASQFSRIYQP